MPGRSWRKEKTNPPKNIYRRGGRETQQPWPGSDFFPTWGVMRAERGYELFVCYGAQFRLKSLTAKWIPKDRRMVGGTFIIWVLIDFLTSLLNFLQEIYGVETNVVSRRVGVFFIFIWYYLKHSLIYVPNF